MLYLVLYAISGVITLVTENYENKIFTYSAKILLMPLLVLYLYQHTKKNIKAQLFIYLALFFSWIGDILLMFPRNIENENCAKLLFIGGLIAFLMAHLNYIAYFYREQKINFRKTLLFKQPYWLIPFLIYVVVFLNILFPSLGNMKTPVVVYAVIINSMAVMALNRKRVVCDKSFWWVFIGALFFVISDSGIAINVFYKPFTAASLIIMVTYMLAQVMIIKGIIFAMSFKSA